MLDLTVFLQSQTLPCIECPWTTTTTTREWGCSRGPRIITLMPSLAGAVVLLIAATVLVVVVAVGFGK